VEIGYYLHMGISNFGLISAIFNGLLLDCNWILLGSLWWYWVKVDSLLHKFGWLNGDRLVS